MGVVYQPLVLWAGGGLTAGLYDPIADANTIDHLEVEK